MSTTSKKASLFPDQEKGPPIQIAGLAIYLVSDWVNGLLESVEYRKSRVWEEKQVSAHPNTQIRGRAR